MDVHPGDFVLVSLTDLPSIIEVKVVGKNYIEDTEGSKFSLDVIHGVPLESKWLDKFDFLKADLSDDEEEPKIVYTRDNLNIYPLLICQGSAIPETAVVTVFHDKRGLSTSSLTSVHEVQHWYYKLSSRKNTRLSLHK